MVSNEYGLNQYGQHIKAENAIIGMKYKCPTCYNKLIVTHGKIRKPYFKHSPQHVITPYQMMCPGYTGNILPKDLDEIDKIYLTNGGIPIKLVRVEDKGKSLFKIKAILSKIQDENYNILMNNNSKIIYDDGSGYNEKHSLKVDNNYNIKTINEWIKVNVIPSHLIKEVKRKWEWGIRGVNIKYDFFYYSDYDSNYRIPLQGNIIVGKKYAVIRRKNRENCDGITFEKIGEIILSKISYNIFSMEVYEINQDSTAYVKGKGYELLNENVEIIPLWPPCVSVEKNNIHQSSNSSNIYYDKLKCKNNDVIQITEFEKKVINPNNDIIKISLKQNAIKDIVTYNKNFNMFAYELLFSILFKNVKKNIEITPKLKYLNSKGDELELLENTNVLFDQHIIEYHIKYKFNVYCMKNNYMIWSYDKAGYASKDSNIIFDLYNFGRRNITYKNIADENTSKHEILEVLDLKKLSKCSSGYIVMNDNAKKLIEYSKYNNLELYKLLMKWKLNNYIPVEVLKMIRKVNNKLEEKENNER